MDYSFIDLLVLAGALGFFIFGMKQMSDGLQKLGGPLMRKVLASMTHNPVLGIITGFVITALVQSSSASTVMVVSFVNAGILTLSESMALIMGANIGTTITAWLVALLGFRTSVAVFALPIIAIGVPLMFSSRALLNAWAQTLIGLALLFLALGEMVEAVPQVIAPSYNPLMTLLAGSETGYLTLLLFASVGIVLTLIAQSSSAAIAMILVLGFRGWVPFETGAAMVLGANIGTTITANLAAIVGNVHAKRAARAHLILNVIGVLWMILFLPVFLQGIASVIGRMGLASPFTDSAQLPVALSIFHSAFNVINVMLLVWFIPQITRLVTRLQPSHGNETFHLEFIGKGLVQTAEISLHEAQKEILKFAETDRKAVATVQQLVNETEPDMQQQLAQRIQQYEEITDRMELEIDRFLTQLSTAQLSDASSQRVRSLLVVVNHLENIGDICFQMSKGLERKSKKKLWFDQQQRDEINDIYQLADRAVTLMMHNLELPLKDLDLSEAIALEREINTLRHTLRTKNFKRIEKGKVKLEAGLIYNDLVSGFEKVGDNVFQVSEALKGMNLE